MKASFRWSPPVAVLLSAVGLLSLVIPFLVLGGLQLFDNALILDTEQSLIAEAVVVGEVYRSRQSPGPSSEPMAAPLDEALRYGPFVPRLDLASSPVLNPTTRVGTATGSDDPLSLLLRRAQVRTLSGVRVIDAQGMVVASAGREVGYRLDHLPEVRAALSGDYAPVLRRRFRTEPAPPLSSLSRAADVRVSIAVPIFVDPRARPGLGADVLGAVYSSRTPLEPAKAFWAWRRKLYPPMVASTVIVLLVALFLGFTIRRPLGRLRRYAEAVANGRSDAAYLGATVEPAEVRALTATVEVMRRQLEARADYIREFAANAAHELKTPLTSLRGASELLLEDGATMKQPQREQLLDNIRADALRMNQLVSGILELARIESVAPDRQRLSLPSLLSGLKERYRRSGHDVRIACPPALELSAAPDLLESMLTNLLDNAVRHGQGEPVDVTVTTAGTQITIDVVDRGPPVPPEKLDRVFDRFYSTTRGSGGTGLGLSIVRAVAEAHGGTASARPGPVGAQFSVTFPSGSDEPIRQAPVATATDSPSDPP